MTDILLTFQQQIQAMLKRLERVEAREGGVIYGTWVPTFVGFSADPTDVICRYSLIGKVCIASVYMGTSGTSNATNFTMTAPLTSANIAGNSWINQTYYLDNSAAGSGGIATIAANSTTITLLKASAANWTASGGKRASFIFVYEVA